MSDINGIHHVGSVVPDLAEAIELYQKLGFTMPPPSGAFGVASSRAYLRHSFLELIGLTTAGETIDVPEAAVRKAASRLSVGTTILIFNSADIDASAARLDAAGIAHSGVIDIQRPITTESGTRMVPARFLEFGGTPEGRIGIAQNSTMDDPGVTHANGAVDVIGCTLHSPDPAATRARYETYLGTDPSRFVTFVAGPAHAFTGCTVATTDTDLHITLTAHG